MLHKGRFGVIYKESANPAINTDVHYFRVIWFIKNLFAFIQKPTCISPSQFNIEKSISICLRFNYMQTEIVFFFTYLFHLHYVMLETTGHVINR